MSKESLSRPSRLATSWAEIEVRFPEEFELNPHHRRFTKDYFRAKLTHAKGQETRAKQMFRGLEKRAGYLEFEDAEENQPLLAAIDLATTGSTNRTDEVGQPVVPLFTINSFSNF